MKTSPDHTREKRPITQRLASCDDGAIVVFGVFFAVLALGMLYYFVGIAATIYYRERMQDAADAGAFASAIAHARGMNTLALINMVMAAILSVLVALRLIEALVIIAEAILYALSFFGGATAAVASALEVVRQEVVSIRDAAEPVVQNVLKVLNVAGDVVRVVTPLGSNAGVLTSVRKNYEPEVAFVFAMPARFTLPVEDDTYDYLCKKAGVMAIKLAMLPLSPILPGFIESGVSDATGSLVEAGSSWFCGDGEAPSVNIQPEAPKFPRTDEQTKCMDRNKSDEYSITNCRKAEAFNALASPDRWGKCRVNQPACVEMDDPDSPGGKLPFRPESWCGSEGQGRMITLDDCAMVPAPDGRMVADEKTPYGQLLRLARQQCVPDGKKNNYSYEQRESLVTWNRDDKGNWTQVGEPVELSVEVRGTEGQKEHPCQVGGVNEAGRALGIESEYWPLSKEWDTGPITEPVCIAEERKPSDPRIQTVQLKRVEVLQIIGCAEPKPEKVSQKVDSVNIGQDRMQDAVDIGGDAGGDWKDVKLGSGDPGGGAATDTTGAGMDGTGGEDGAAAGGQGQGGEGESTGMEPFRFEKEHLLGTSDMQIRAFAIGRAFDAPELNGEPPEPEEGEESAPREKGTAHTQAKFVVEMTKWHATGGELTTLADLSEVWGRIAVAQAEYYFDVSGERDDFADWSGKDGERDYLWYMGWTARMRRFRLSWEVDGESADGASGGEDGHGMSSDQNTAILGMFGGDDFDPSQQKDSGDLQESGPSVMCMGNGECESLAEQLSSFASLFLH